MRRLFNRRRAALLSAVLAAAGILMLEVWAQPEITWWVLYPLPLLTLMYWGKKRDVYLVSLLCIALLYAGYVLSRDEQALAPALTNRLLMAGVLSILALVIGRRIDSRRELLRHHARLRHTLDERNSALELVMAEQGRLHEENTRLAKQIAALALPYSSAALNIPALSGQDSEDTGCAPKADTWSPAAGIVLHLPDTPQST